MHRVLLFASVVLLADALVGDHGLRATLEAGERYERSVAELQVIQRENVVLREQMRRLTHDPQAVEAEARGALGLVRSGEVLFVVHSR